MLFRSRLGERESGTAQLEEAVTALRAALTERTRERVPLQWAASTANLGAAHTLLADRAGDALKAQTALSQIELALATALTSGDILLVTYCRELLPKAHAIVERLSNR